MACLAVPLCPLAITEVERGILDLLKRVQAVFEKVGLKNNEFVVIRVTGCPNGYARPYIAELGLVGAKPYNYQIWLGEIPNQTSLVRTLHSHLWHATLMATCLFLVSWYFNVKNNFFQTPIFK